MISILISTYNQDPSTLVKDLSGQLQKEDIPWEIIVGNDHSESNFMPFFNDLKKLDKVRCFNSEVNLGRSKIRNTLAGEAKYPFLIFLDGDAKLESDDFVRKYVDSMSAGIVYCGGTAYHESPPNNKNEILRWKYGVEREARSASKRNDKPYHSFSSFNFLIPAEVFRNIGFNEKITRYGHEDTLFGIELEMNGVPVNHLDNQLIHAGLDSAQIFLEKTEDSIINLINLISTYKDPDTLYQHIRLLKRYIAFRKFGLTFIISIIHSLFGAFIRRNLAGSSPSIKLFDLYKLCLLNDNQG